MQKTKYIVLDIVFITLTLAIIRKDDRRYFYIF